MSWWEHLATLLPDVMGWDRAWPWLLLSLAGGYLIGSVPFGVLVTRAMGLRDPRSAGSGNIGATNVLRTNGKAAAAGTLALDLAKGWAAVALFGHLYGPLPSELAGIGACLGHCFPVWLRFRGGKAVATFLGVMLGFSLFAALLCAATWLAVAALFRFSSLAALAMALAAPVWMAVAGPNSAIWAAALLALLVWARHGENIRRLLAGTETRIGQK